MALRMMTIIRKTNPLKHLSIQPARRAKELLGWSRGYFAQASMAFWIAPTYPAGNTICPDSDLMRPEASAIHPQCCRVSVEIARSSAFFSCDVSTKASHKRGRYRYAAPAYFPRLAGFARGILKKEPSRHAL